MISVADRVRETTTSTGVGAMSLGGAVTGFQAFSTAFVTGDVVYYCITDGTDWEVGYGTLTTGTPWTLSRDTVLDSSNAGALVNWVAGSKEIFNTAPAKQIASIGLNAGTYAKPTIVDNADGSVTIGSGEYCFYNNASGEEPITKVTIAGALYLLTDGVINYIVADYNSGSPIIHVLTSTSTFNFTTVFPIFRINRIGTSLDILDWDSDGIALSSKILHRLINTKFIDIEPGGFTLGEAATRYVTVTAGYFWNGVKRTYDAAYNSSVDAMTFYYHVAGVWTRSTITQYNNSQYDDGTNLVALGTAKYAVNWIFKSARSDAVEETYVVLGSGNYNLAQAQASTVPAGLPPEISATGFLVGRIIVALSATTATQIDSAFSANLDYATDNVATALVTTTTNVDVSSSIAPTAGDHLEATSGTTAVWANPLPRIRRLLTLRL